MKRKIFLFLLLIAVSSVAFAQDNRKDLRRGNRNFGKGNYDKAEVDYKKAVEADTLSCAARYNLGNAYYRTGNMEEALKAYEAAKDSMSRTEHASKLFHNMGNAYIAQKNWQGAVDAFKNSLRHNPSDISTKANLTYAKKMLEDQQNQDQNKDDQNKDQNQQDKQDQNQNQNQDQNQNQNKDDQKQDQNQQDKQDQKNNDQNQNDKDKQDRDGQQPQGDRQPQMSRQDARQMLQAIEAQEKDTQEKVKKEKAVLLQSKQKEKNW